ncbi:MAG: LamB/YcsF family protein, partial [Nocardioidaceae bacterium]
MPRIIDLNADLGEGVTDDEGLLAVVTSANVACGYHAGDRETMLRVCEEASRRGVAVGAQVSYDDRANFGRVSVDVAYEVLRDQVADQVQVLSAIAVSVGTTVSYVKPHGALYHRMCTDDEVAGEVVEAVVACGAPGGPPPA